MKQWQIVRQRIKLAQHTWGTQIVCSQIKSFTPSRASLATSTAGLSLIALIFLPLYLLLHTFKVPIAWQLTYKSKFGSVCNNLWQHLGWGSFSNQLVPVLWLHLDDTAMFLTAVLMHPTVHPRKPRWRGALWRMWGLQDTPCAPQRWDRANTLPGQPRYHYLLPSLWALGILTPPRQELFGSALSLLCSTTRTTLAVAADMYLRHLLPLAAEKKQWHSLAPEGLRSNTHC